MTKVSASLCPIHPLAFVIDICAYLDFVLESVQMDAICFQNALETLHEVLMLGTLCPMNILSHIHSNNQKKSCEELPVLGSVTIDWLLIRKLLVLKTPLSSSFNDGAHRCAICFSLIAQLSYSREH